MQVRLDIECPTILPGSWTPKGSAGASEVRRTLFDPTKGAYNISFQRTVDRDQRSSIRGSAVGWLYSGEVDHGGVWAGWVCWSPQHFHGEGFVIRPVAAVVGVSWRWVAGGEHTPSQNAAHGFDHGQWAGRCSILRRWAGSGGRGRSRGDAEWSFRGPSRAGRWRGCRPALSRPWVIAVQIAQAPCVANWFEGRWAERTPCYVARHR